MRRLTYIAGPTLLAVALTAWLSASPAWATRAPIEPGPKSFFQPQHQMWSWLRARLAPWTTTWSWSELIPWREPAAPRLSVLPVAAKISSRYGYRSDPLHGRRRMHRGIDFAAPRGTPVRAAASGLVVEAHRVRGYGRLVVIDHGDGLETRYAHLRRITVQVGERVGIDTLIGVVGQSGRATGPHLHFEVRRGGRPMNPLRAY